MSTTKQWKSWKSQQWVGQWGLVSEHSGGIPRDFQRSGRDCEVGWVNNYSGPDLVSWMLAEDAELIDEEDKGDFYSLHGRQKAAWTSRVCRVPLSPLSHMSSREEPTSRCCQAIGLHQLRNPKPREPQCYALPCVTPQKSSVEALTPTVTMFGGGAFRGVTKIKWGVLIRIERHSNFPPHVRTEEKPWKTQWEEGHLQARKRASTRSQTCLHFDRGLLSLWNYYKINTSCLSHPRCGILLWHKYICYGSPK